jgi:type II secretory pathway pseudopilin PulG
MTRTIRPRITARRRGGWSLVEVMISLTISAMLLTSIAAAFSASSAAIEQNDRFYRASQAARVSMNQILDAVRRSQSLRLTLLDSPPSSVTSSWCEVLTFNGHDYTYKFENNQLMLVDNDDPDLKEYRLASNVVSASFVGDYVDLPAPHCVRVTLDIIVQVGNNRVHLSGAAVPRRQLSY